MNNTSVAIDLDEARLPLKVINLAWPVIAEQTFTTFVGLAGTIMVGRLGAASLAGIGLASQVVWFPEVILNGVAVGATAVIARRIGEGRQREAGDALHQSILMAAIIGLLFTLPAWFFAEPIMVLLRAQGEVVDLGAMYIRASAPSLAAAMVMFAANAAMRGAGDTRTPMISMIITNVVNIVIGYVLIFGFFWIPGMGVLGAGIAGSISWCVGCALSLGFLVRGRKHLRYELRRALSFDLQTAGQILKVGFPAGLEQFQFQLAFTLFSVIIAALGTTVYAAHTVALRIENIAFMPGFGLGMAATTLVGQALGAGRPDIAQRVAKIAQWYAVAMMTFFGILMGVFRNEMMAIFVSDREVIEIGAMALVIYAFSMPFMGTSNCLSGSLRGAGDTRAVLYIMTAGVWLIRLPSSYALAYWLGFGAAGAWSAAVMDISVRGLLFWWRFAAGHWKTIKV